MGKFDILYKSSTTFRSCMNVGMFLFLLLFVTAVYLVFLPYISMYVLHQNEVMVNIDSIYTNSKLALICFCLYLLMVIVGCCANKDNKIYNISKTLILFFFTSFTIETFLAGVTEVESLFLNTEMTESNQWIFIIYVNAFIFIIYADISFNYAIFTLTILPFLQKSIYRDVGFSEDFQLQYNTMIISQEEQQKNKRIFKFDSKHLKKEGNSQTSGKSPIYLILGGLLLLKIVLASYYIISILGIILDRDLLSKLIIIFFVGFVNISAMSVLFSNKDLKKKIHNISFLSDQLSFDQSEERDLLKKLDITCPISLETWDNIRRAEYQAGKAERDNTEYTYILSFVFYLFTLVIVLEGYFDFNIVFQKGSFFLEPLNLLCNSCDFLLYSTIIIFRIYFIDEFNGSFDDCSEKIEALIGEYEDLEQLYSLHFIYSGISSHLISSNCNTKEVPLKALLISKLKKNAEEENSKQPIYKDNLLNQDMMDKYPFYEFNKQSREIIIQHIDIFNKFGEFLEKYYKEENRGKHNSQSCEQQNCEECEKADILIRLSYFASELASYQEKDTNFIISEAQFYYSLNFFIDKQYYKRYEYDQIVIQYFFNYLHKRYLRISQEEQAKDPDLFKKLSKVEDLFVQTFKIDKTKESEFFEDIEQNLKGGYGSKKYELKLCRNNKLSIHNCYSYFIEYMTRTKKNEALNKENINNLLMSLRRINSQIASDSKSQRLKAFQLVEVNFKEFMITLFIGFLTILPQVWTKLNEIFSIPQK